MSELNEDNVASLEFLGFNIDEFLHIATNGSSLSNSSYFPHPNVGQIEQLERYANDKGYRVRLKCDQNGSFLQVPNDVHDSPCSYLSYMVYSNNVTRTKSSFDPMRVLGSGNTTVNNTICHPEWKCRVINRTQNSPNIVVEIHYRNGHSDTQFHARLLSYFTGTPDIMIVIGFRIFERNPQGTFEALIIVYERTEMNQPAVSYNASFGTAEISPTHATSWTDGTLTALTAITPGATVPPLVGVGISASPPCTTATGTTSPYLVTLRQDLMLCTNHTVPYTYNDNLAPVEGLDFQVNLSVIQNLIQDSLE